MPIIDLDPITDEDLSILMEEVAAEVAKRRRVASAQQHMEAIAAQYAADTADASARIIADIPVGEAVGPGGRVIDGAGVEWVNQSGAWLSPHTAGPADYAMGWRLATPPVGADPWAPGVAYAVDDLADYQGAAYKCIQAHTSQAGWEPPAVPALWAVA